MMQSKISCVGAMFVKQMHFEQVGDVMEGHSHTFDHQTLVAYGSVGVEVNGVTTDFKAPQIVYIRKGTLHKITALEAGTVAYCIHPIRDGEELTDIIDPDGVPAAVEYKPENMTPLAQ